MARGKGITEYRTLGAVTVESTGAPNSIDFGKAAYALIEKLEAEHAKVPKTAADALAGVATFITGNVTHRGYGVTVTADFVAGDYTVTYVEDRPNATNDIS